MDTEDIRKHVSTIGQNIQLVTEMILGSVDTTDYDFENNTAIAGSSNRICDNYKTIKCKGIEQDMDVEELNSNELYINIDSNDSDTDDSFSVISEESSSNNSLTSYERLLDGIEFSNATIVHDDDHIIPCASVDIEIFEENNNDPNNNLDSTQSYQEQTNFSSENTASIQRRKTAEFESNSISGCSKDSDIQTKIREEALQIHNLLPQFAYETIYKVLNKHNFAENRVMLSLWDLLSTPISIMKVANDNSVKGCSQMKRDNTLIFAKNVEQNKKEINYNKNLDEDIVILNDIENYSLNKENVQNTDNFQGKERVSQLKQKAILTKFNTVCQSTQNRILHPPKLILNNKTCERQVTSYKNSILTPAVWTEMYKISKNKNKLMYPKKCKNSEFVNNKNISLGKNVFQPNSINARVINDKQIKLGTLDNYMQYLSYIENVKKQKLYKNVKNFNFPGRNQTRQYFLHSQFRVSAKDISQYINKNNKLKLLNIPNINCNTYDAAKYSKTKKVKLLKPNKISKGSNDMLNIETVDLTEDDESFQDLLKDAVSASTSYEIASTSTIPQNLHTNSSHDTSIQVTTTTVTDPVSATSSNNPRNSIFSAQSSLQELATDLGIERSQFSVTAVPENSTVSSLTSTDDKRFNPSSSTGFNNPSSSQIFESVEKEKYNIQETDNQSSEYIQIYKELKSIFPQIDEDFIKDTCLKFFKMETHRVPTEMLQNLIEYILENIETCPIKKQSKCVSRQQTCDINKQVANLSSIFPKADVTYLRKIVQSLKGDENAIIEFIQTQCKNPTYMTKEEKLKRISITEQQKQYTSNFDVKKFLEVFPNPFQYFENPNRKCEYKVDAYKFIKSRFKYLQEITLLFKYTAYEFNLSLTVQALEKLETDACSGPFIGAWEINLSEDIPLLQECAFIRYRQQIKECSTCNDGHIFCNSCIIKGVKIKLAQGDTRMLCFVECNEEFNLSTLERILSPTQFSILISKKQEQEVMAAGLPGLVSCPFCTFASIPPPEDKIFKCLNPECMKESCRLCKELNHVPLRCYEEKTDKARLVLEEKMTEALVRKCYKCAKPYFKEDGCNKITCSCGAIMCYICDKQIEGYGHFNNGSCPLESDNRTLNADTVNEVLKQTLKYLIEKDPNVQLDASRFLLHSKRSKTCNAALLERVNKITKFDM
nr:uncharacterized protein LOC116424202 isoform X2 [Nomia melanderi]